MYHFVEAITNTKGDALIGYFVKAVDSSGNVASIYADESSTPIISVSGVANAAKVDSDGNASFYVAGGTYHLDIYATDSTTFVRRISNIPMVDFTVAAGKVSSRATLAGFVAANGDAYDLIEPGRDGTFVFDSSDLSAEVAADTLQGIYVPPSSDTTGASGAWVRAERDVVNVFWFMSAAEVADVRAGTLTQNVTLALKAASAYVQGLGGGTLLVPPGKYLVGAQTFNGTTLDGGTTVRYGATEIITIKNCTRPVKISGYGAVLKCAPGLKYGSFDAAGVRYNPVLPFLDYSYYSYIYRGMINVEGNASVTIEGFELDGNNTLLTLGGYWGDSQWQIEGSGIWCRGNGSALIQDCYIHHHPTDGLILNPASVTEGTVPAVTTVKNVRCRYNGRQGISLTGGKNIRIDNCDLSQTGQALNTVSSELVQSAPGAGIDIEASNSIIRDVTLSNTTIIGNWLKGVGVSSGDSRRVTFDRCKIEYIILSRPNYTFTDSTLLGFFSLGLDVTDQYKPNSSATLTIAGAGPYTITRSAGSFITDGFSLGDTVMLPNSFAGSGCNAGLSAGNKGTRLFVTGITATVLTVKVIGGGTMVAEGPIATCVVATATTAKDAQVFRNCRFSYDATLTESGTLINSSQAALDNFVFGQMEKCTIETGSVNLPTMTTPALDESAPLFINCRFKSGATAAVNLWARYQGYNYIEHGGTPTLNIGTKSRIENGDIFVNGTSQGGDGQRRPVDGDYGDVVFSSSGTVGKVESATASSINFPIIAAAASDLFLNLNGNSGKSKAVQIQKGGLNRWQIGDDGTAESGSNAGCNFSWVRYDDGGSFLGYVMTATRSTGNVTFNNGISFGGGTTLTKAVVYTPSITPASVAANTTAEQTFTVTGLTTADTVTLNTPSQTNGIGVVGVRVSAADTLAIRFSNNTAGALTPASGTHRVLAIRS
jgi:hypothetical protein